MKKREIDAVASALADPENSERTAEEVAALAIQALDDVRSRTHRLAVVGQIQYGPQEETHTVILGPFSSPLLLDSPDKLKAVLARPCTDARKPGQALAWDPSKKTGAGRFMLAPMFGSARDAWDFYRGSAVAEEVVEAVSVLPRGISPACLCGLKHTPPCRFCAQEVELHCPLHEPEAEVHRCTAA
ncbi:hypothetical protein ACFUJU_08045 [Streptomyces sp. NPDC057235]|uniref:hypothetical protein n=1 Tax=Streptomyces sp. NPDC057235 TaxID=3346058 RepID=UPI0036311A2B